MLIHTCWTLLLSNSAFSMISSLFWEYNLNASECYLRPLLWPICLPEFCPCRACSHLKPFVEPTWTPAIRATCSCCVCHVLYSLCLHVFLLAFSVFVKFHLSFKFHFKQLLAHRAFPVCLPALLP